MPIYEYRCQNGHEFELLRSFSDPPVSTCEVCDAPAKKLLRPPAIHFKGSGFHNTDYGRARRVGGSGGEGESGGGSDGKPAESGGNSGSGSEKKDAGGAAKSESGSSSSASSG